ncbi:MAG: TetR family transcriptional regulator [Anaerolineaceae bacterium]|nr:TetR family transcriptional regulator [Anaerolineaceae bacterium]
MTSADRMRRVPQQQRSQKRVEFILDTAAALFAAHGVDQVTTNHIAESAEISVGSLYRFFPNKEAIIAALVKRYMDAATAIFPDRIDTTLPIESIMRDVIMCFVRFSREQTGFEVVLVGLGGAYKSEAATEMQAVIIEGISQVLATYYPTLNAARRHRCAQVSFGLVAGLMPLELTEAEMVSEMVLAVAAYQSAFLQRERL